MGISCCTSRDARADGLLEQVRDEMTQKYKSRVEMRPIVNMISETSKPMHSMNHLNSIKARGNSSQYNSESDADKLDLKVELLLQHLKQDLKLLKRKHQSMDSKEF